MKNYLISEEQANHILTVLLQYTAKDVLTATDIIRFKLRPVEEKKEQENGNDR